MKLKKTNRGFCYYNFLDYNKEECSIQKSSLATENAIWFGINKPTVKQLIKNQGWKDITPINDENNTYLISDRMHLTQKQIKKLLPILIKFAETGEI